MSDLFARWGVALMVIAGLLLGFLMPAPQPPDEPPAPIPGDPPYVSCSTALAGSGFESTVGVVADSPAIGTLSGVGVDGPAEDFSLEGNDSFRFEVGSLAELGVTPILVERLEGGELGAGVLGRAGAEAALAGCQPAGGSAVAVLGMATNEGEQSTLVLANPFAVEATARLVGSSEFGPDTIAELETVRVPANSTLALPLGQVMAGRQQVGFTVHTEAGTLVAGMVRSGPDIATSEAITGAQQWFVPAPAFGVDGNVIVRNVSSVEASFRVDALSVEAIAEGVFNVSLQPDSEIWLGTEELGAGNGFLVTADEPVAVAIAYAGDATRVVSSASPTATVAWLIPISADAAGLETALWILNPEETESTAEVTVFGGATTEIVLEPRTTTGQIIPFAGRGGIVTATGPVAVFYGVISDAGAAAMTLAFPLE